MKKLSVVIITYNEAAHIEQCIQSVSKVADEVIVLDSCSTDNTVLLAQQAGATVTQQPFLGYGQQKNKANSLASFEWILSLDADEHLSVMLQQELLDWKHESSNSTIAYRIPRLNQYLGRYMKHGGWFPDAKERLFLYKAGQWSSDDVHEYWAPSPTGSTGQFKHYMFHDTFPTIEQHLKKIERYSELSAKAAVAKGKTISLLKAIIVPKWTFVHKYLFRFGFLDGYEGYLLCKMAAFEKWLKYNKIRKYHKDKIKLR